MGEAVTVLDVSGFKNTCIDEKVHSVVLDGWNT